MASSLTLRAGPGPARAPSPPQRPDPGHGARVRSADPPDGLPPLELIEVVAGRIRRIARAAADRTSAAEA